ncbi:MAG: hypothetical protein ACK4HF_03250 [Paracoccaceae bacterium]
MTDEQPQIPLFAYPPIGPRLTIKDISNAIAAGGVPYPTANARAKIYAKPKEDGSTLIYVRETGRATQPNIYEFSDAGAAVVLSALQDAGIQDHEVLRAASMSLYGWSAKGDLRDGKYVEPGQVHKPRHPIDRAVIGVGFKGESWQFLVNIWRDAQTGERIVDCDLVQFGDPFIGHQNVPTTAIAQVGIVVMLDSALFPVARRLLPETRN